MLNTKERLNNIRLRRRALNALKTRLDDLQHITPKVSNIALKTHPKGVYSGLDALLCAKETLLDEYDALLLEYLGEYAKMSAVIRDNLQGLERDIIEGYYLQGLSWADVGSRLFISQSWCFTLHRRALAKLDYVVKSSFGA